MKKSFYISLFFFFMAMPVILYAQDIQINPGLLQGSWKAHWITCPGVPQKAYGVYHFRKSIELPAKPGRFIIHVSADNRYHLFVNGKSVGHGPARSTLYNWNFGTYNIAPYLHAGKNIIAAQVWNMGEYAPVAQISNQTGFLLQGDTKKEQIANTGPSWKVLHDSAYSPTAINAGSVLHSYVAVGACDEIRGKYYPWGWQNPNYDDSKWQQAQNIPTPVVPSGYGTDNRWTLAPREIPPMEDKLLRIKTVRRSEGLEVNNHFLSGGHPLVVPAGKKVTILLDQSYETVGYPVLQVSGGAGSEIKLTYAEALFDGEGKKGNRDEIKGKTIKGLHDIFYPDGGENRMFSTLWIRTWRYMQIEIKTKTNPLVIKDIYGIFSAYPFQRKAAFSSNDSSLKRIWNIGWHTARLCAGETYFDCPYYEQLQYEGDTRIQALISYYNTGDDRLARKAIHDFYLGRVPSGLTQGRFPSNRLQIIPTYSLFWISMLYDYWMLRPDTDFIKKYLDAADLILKWYEQHIDENYGMLGPMKWWNFVDYSRGFRSGVPPGATDGHSSVITLQYVYTLKQAARLFAFYNRKKAAAHYKSLAEKLARQTYQHCFNKEKMEMADRPERKEYSQHAGIMAILADAIPREDQQKVVHQLLADTTLNQATFYYRFYLNRALIKTGNADLYYENLSPWRDMLKQGLTTFAEKPDPARSDCHAWSASPVYDFLAVICGIMPDAPGFQKVRIAPALGSLKSIKGSMPSPQGMIKVELSRVKDKGIEGYVTLPESLSGRFIWQGKEIPLHGGQQKIQVNN